jgi:hypothetical protein
MLGLRVGFGGSVWPLAADSVSAIRLADE